MSFKGFKHTQKTKDKIRKRNKGKIVSKKTKEKLSELNKGEKHPFYGKHHSQQTKKKMSKKQKGKNNPNYGKKASEKTKEKMSIAQTGNKSHFWKNGRSFEKYTTKWTERLRQTIRKRDNFTCQNCNTHQNKLNQKLDIHHIDYNKQNCNPKNLISLCHSCHSKTNLNRNYWIIYFQIKIQELYYII